MKWVIAIIGVLLAASIALAISVGIAMVAGGDTIGRAAPAAPNCGVLVQRGNYMYLDQYTTNDWLACWQHPDRVYVGRVPEGIDVRARDGWWPAK